ncbi:1-deoxy-D-xylulose-5-phosphate synthase [Arthrobacter roseus]|uniref:1-deoxy-D-xylulose-5-phosphate synthase n=1 Tax=Arthrobacter roseus TaxID=136274 RepID=UPI00196316DB|nr:1-deoxy-D-xylulose-5-phosphate synthase [Arthrobacter roseus]MBM7848393.1 1-deoxy-D-xylulose-5-phosphate synthase [Arthrobacter roseus]
MRMEQIGSPAQLRSVPEAELPQLADSIREFLVSNVSLTGGHLGPNLGVVELTLAIHRVFESPRDSIVFDAGHQAYVHKILTGRQDFRSLRSVDGLSGYPNRAESQHDIVENSHASASIAWADGISRAWRLQGVLGRSAVAIVGDGALTGGMAWESLNNLSEELDRSVVVVVNDNGRSYDPTVGGAARHLAEWRSGNGSSVQQEGIFELLGLRYLGPVDGHNVMELERVLGEAKALRCPVVVHVITEKGRGYAPARADGADQFHTVGAIDPETGKPANTTLTPEPSWTDVFAQAMAGAAEQRADVVAVTAAMSGPTGLSVLARASPDRVIDVGIAEQHALTMAAGLAFAGLHPVVALYSTFLNRAYDQLLMDVALHRAGVTLILDRSGVTGPDGASHHGMWDLALMQTVPGLRVAAPRDARTLREELDEALDVHDAPTALRYGKGAVGPDIGAIRRLPDGTDVLAEAGNNGCDVLLIAVGSTCPMALGAAEQLEEQGLGCTVVDPRWVLPVPPSLTSLASSHQLVVVLEEGIDCGGIEARVRQALDRAHVQVPLMSVGLPEEFLGHGSRTDILDRAGLTLDRIVDRVVAIWPTLGKERSADTTVRPGKEDTVT